jgi:hypothetical protein
MNTYRTLTLLAALAVTAGQAVIFTLDTATTAQASASEPTAVAAAAPSLVSSPVRVADAQRA